MRRSNNNNFKKEKKEMVVKTYQRVCTTAKEAFDSFCAAHPEIEEAIYPTLENQETGQTYKIPLKDSILDSMMENVLSYVDFKRPSIETMSNMSISLNLRPNKVQVKTDKFVGFGWYVKYTKNSRTEAVIDEVDLTITLYGQRSIDECEEYLLNNGWEVVENEK